ncbi:folylpolyglutamate synthase [Dimargaris xerosporica]|nr:folylpolyglutamate synthase [Dimargaris xerosporica]
MTTATTRGIQLGCERLKIVLEAFDHPEQRLKVVRVGGTNGKGSVCACLGAILHEAHYKVGAFNSPHLLEPRDCIAINGVPIDPTSWAGLQKDIKTAESQHTTPLTNFERLTLSALVWFDRQKVDLAIMEVGVGGRRDSTSVCQRSALVSVLTSIGLDHVGLIGDTLTEIAEEKSGIINSGGVTIVAEQPYPEIIAVLKHAVDTVQPQEALLVAPARRLSMPTDATTKDAIEDSPEVLVSGNQYELDWTQCTNLRRSLSHSDTLSSPATGTQAPTRPPLVFRSPLLGSFQLANFAAALHAVDALRRVYQYTIDDATIQAGMAKCHWPGRLETHPFPCSTGDSSTMDNAQSSTHRASLLVDGAHNPDSAKALALFVDEEWRPLTASLIHAPLPERHSAAPEHVVPVVWIFGCSQGKDALSILRVLFHPKDRLLIVPFTSPVDMPWVQCQGPLALTQLVVEEFGDNHENIADSVTPCSSLGQAMALISNNAWDRSHALVLCGSLYLVADYYRQYRPRHQSTDDVIA